MKTVKEQWIELGRPDVFYIQNINNRRWKHGIFQISGKYSSETKDWMGFCNNYYLHTSCSSNRCSLNNPCNGYSWESTAFRILNITKITKKVRLLYKDIHEFKK